MAKLLDLGMNLSSSSQISNYPVADMICFESCTVVHCDERLRLGSHVILSVKVYIRPAAFRKNEPIDDDGTRTLWNEGKETQTEKMLRNRMASLLEMFKILCLHPRKTSPLKNVKATQHKSIDASMRQLSVQPGGPEDEEELDDNELNLIYQK
jgi:DNA repair protein RAD5